ncbi:MAG: cell division protein FtsQ [Muribaculaceae bacterium]|nr:cell division protein FtsQ [Muribaculaceae bacterium]
MNKTLKKITALIPVALTIIFATYLIGSLFVCSRMSANVLCTGMRISVSDPEHRSFVTAGEIAKELGSLPESVAGTPLSEINTFSLTKHLQAIDKIEDISIIRTSQGLISIDVVPLVPVARIFDGNKSYYINKDGKRISANARYYSDVPVIVGHFPPNDSLFPPTSLIPLLDYIAGDPKRSDLVTMIKVDSPHDIILVPPIAGHVINFGDVSDFDSKFQRIEKMYAKVLPAKGWNYYDTLSVKWGGQVVATRRDKPKTEAPIDVTDEDDDANVTTMLAAEGVAPGQTKVGAKAKDDKPIPAANNTNKSNQQ